MALGCYLLSSTKPNMRFRIAFEAVALIMVMVSASAVSRNQASDATDLYSATGPNSFVDLLALVSGNCKTLKIAGREFGCKVVAYAHGDKGRVNFAVAVDGPSDDSHVVSFSGENGKRADDNSYELPIDRMLLNSKDRPRVGGLPVPAKQTSTGVCRQTGNFAARQVNRITCSATDVTGKSYELLFISDGKPVSVRRIRQSTSSAQEPFK